MTKIKQCSKCKKWKSLSEFNKVKNGKYGVRGDCKKCNKKYQQTIIGCLHYCFANIKHRCNNSKCKDYKWYGARGIKCLFKSSQEFINYIINELQIDPRNLQIDRIDNNGHYEPGNIRFVTAKINSNNRRSKWRKEPK